MPLVLIVSVLSGGGTAWSITLEIGKTVGLAIVLIGAFFLLFNYVVPMVLLTGTMQRNRELPTLLAIVVGLGSAWAAHALGLSPAMGAFVAGMLLAESPFATQIRADVTSLRTLLTTLFFASIGMLGDPVWIAQNVAPVVLVVGAIVVGKATLIWIVLRRFGESHPAALAAGICLAQVGEFSFVLAQQARGGLIDDDIFRLIVSATIVTLFLTPYLVIAAPTLAWRIVHVLERATGGRLCRVGPDPGAQAAEHLDGRIIIVGFGPAGQRVGETLTGEADRVTVVDLNPKLVRIARERGFHGYVGDAGHPTVIDHLHVDGAAAVVVTVPDPPGAQRVIEQVRAAAPEVKIIARARYHLYAEHLREAGADAVIDEEHNIGLRIAAELRRVRRHSLAAKQPERSEHADEH